MPACARREPRASPSCRTVQTGFDEETGEPVFETEVMEPEQMP